MGEIHTVHVPFVSEPNSENDIKYVNIWRNYRQKTKSALFMAYGVIDDYLGPSKPSTQTASLSVQLFLHSSAPSVPILYNGPLFHHLQNQNYAFDGDLDQFNAWFRGPRVLNPTGISIGSVILQGYITIVTYRPTDYATRSVTIGRIYVRSTAMWPNNKNVSLKDWYMPSYGIGGHPTQG